MIINVVYVETIRRIYEENSDAFLEIGPWSDNTEFLELRTTSKESIEWWGTIGCSMSKAFANKLGRALIAASEECSR